MAGRSRHHGGDRGRHRHGPAAQDAAAGRRAVPSGEHRDRARPQAARQFPAWRRLQSVRCARAAMSALLATPVTDLKGFIGLAAQGRPLTRAQAEMAFGIMMSGEATPAQIGGLLMAMRVRGETIDEITGAVSVMREKMLRISALPDAIDVCGTGGDQAGTLNISTAVAFVCAACNVPVAKHGNRAASSKSGAADVLA